MCHLWGPPSAVPDLSPSLSLQGLVSRLKESMEKLTEERDHHVAAESREKEQNKRVQRQTRDLKEEMVELAKKEAEASRKKHELVSLPPHQRGEPPSATPPAYVWSIWANCII